MADRTLLKEYTAMKKYIDESAFFCILPQLFTRRI